MKNKFKSLSISLLIVFLLTTISCQVEETIVETENIKNQNDLLIKKISFNEINNSIVVDKINKTKTLTKRTASASNKIIKDTLNNFYINSDEGMYIEKTDGTKSYTFFVFRENSTDLENLVIIVYPNNEVKTFLVDYNKTFNELNSMSLEQMQNNQIEYYEINFNTNELIPVFQNNSNGRYICETIMFWDSTLNCDEGDLYGADNPQGTCGGWVIIGHTCWEGGSGGGEGFGFDSDFGTNGNGSPTGGGGSTGSGSSGSSSNQIITTPTTSLESEQEAQALIKRQKNFTTNLSWNQNAWLNNNQEAENNIFEYLESQVTDLLATEYSAESVDFIKEAIIALMNGGEININNEIIVEESFSNNQKTYCVFQKLLSLSNNSHFKKIIVDLFDSNDKANVIFSIANLPSGYDAVTSPQARGGITSHSLYKITLDQNFVNNASTIEIALTLIHELIHAELLERCLRLGIISNMGFNSTTYNGLFSFNSSGQQISPMDNYGLSFLNLLIQEYRNYSNQSEWNHNLMTGLNYNNIISQNLLEAYPLLNNPSFDFLNNINNDINNTNGAFTLNEAFYFLSWRGLENTQNYINLIQSNTTSLNKKNYIETASNNKFNNTCN
ncbi:MAG: hypothetical protein EKK56_01830 [Flavobacteriaceae bacterium]|nr:MAG: hypothetical protein EKK56_01830 [Flavobacteriaceae bacterium]